MVAYYEQVATAVGDGKQAANRLSDFVLSALNERKEEIDQFPVSAAAFADFLKQTAGIAQQDRRGVFQHMLEHASDAGTAMKALNVQPPSAFDERALRAAVREAMAANAQAVEDFRKGKAAAANRIKGHVMKANKGAPNDVVQRLLEEELAKG
jgi:aspartyl-tRNA(Asn)/glutamyl-tRNA(Gln) amidotransferase subunit B